MVPVTNLLWGIAIVVFVLGLVCIIGAWLFAHRQDAPRAGILGSLGSGLITGATISIVVVVLQSSLQQAVKSAEEPILWKANVRAATTLAGFDPKRDGHANDIQDIDFSGKTLLDANLSGLNLRGVNFENAKLPNANLRDADLGKANLVEADLSTADLHDANLTEAHLEGARFDRAQIEHAKSLNGAIASPKTCWPSGFLETHLAKDVVAGWYDDGLGNRVQGKGHEYPCS